MGTVIVGILYLINILTLSCTVDIIDGVLRGKGSSSARKRSFPLDVGRAPDLLCSTVRLPVVVHRSRTLESPHPYYMSILCQRLKDVCVHYGGYGKNKTIKLKK